MSGGQVREEKNVWNISHPLKSDLYVKILWLICFYEEEKDEPESRRELWIYDIHLEQKHTRL